LRYVFKVSGQNSFSCENARRTGYNSRALVLKIAAQFYDAIEAAIFPM